MRPTARRRCPVAGACLLHGWPGITAHDLVALATAIERKGKPDGFDFSYPGSPVDTVRAAPVRRRRAARRHRRPSRAAGGGRRGRLAVPAGRRGHAPTDMPHVEVRLIDRPELTRTRISTSCCSTPCVSSSSSGARGAPCWCTASGRTAARRRWGRCTARACAGSAATRRCATSSAGASRREPELRIPQGVAARLHPQSAGAGQARRSDPHDSATR